MRQNYFYNAVEIPPLALFYAASAKGGTSYKNLEGLAEYCKAHNFRAKKAESSSPAVGLFDNRNRIILFAEFNPLLESNFDFKTVWIDEDFEKEIDKIQTD